MPRRPHVKAAAVAAAAVLLAIADCAVAATAGMRCRNTGSFERWLDGFKQEALAQGISPRALAAALPYLTFEQRIIHIDRGQRVFQQNFLEFSKRMVAPYRISQGTALMKKHADLFARIEQRYGVPAPVITAFWALESDFGKNLGKEPVLRSLATLAYDCRRSEMFRGQLLDALRLIERGDLAPAEMIGAWAGEVGQLQMMPTEYNKYAVDYDGDGRRDLLRSVPDVLASAANYLAHFGWRRGEPWLEEVRVPAEMPWEQADVSIEHPRSQWARWGVTRADGRPLPADAQRAALLLPMGRLGPAFLAYPNFQAFLKWNQSLVYSTTAAYLATRLAGAPPVSPGRGAPPALSPAQLSELQRLLARAGFDPGEIDGKLGLQTRAAVRAAQLRLGLPADSYPTPELIAYLRNAR